VVILSISSSKGCHCNHTEK